MPREKFHTLTEQMFYVLLCLKEECYGMDILDKVPAMTKKRVTVGCGTLYNLLEQFLEAKMICEMYGFEPQLLEELLPEQLKTDVQEQGWLQLLCGVHACDGFFIARLRKK